MDYIMSLVLQSSGGGQITIQEPATASNFTQTLPAATGTVMVSGNMPAFSAYSNLGQTLSNSTFTKIQFNVENFDTASAYDNTTNYRFTPLVAGYYQVNGNFSPSGASSGYGQFAIYKNGAEVTGGSAAPNNTSVGAQCTASTVLYLNGSTDYVEIYGWQNSGGNLTLQTSARLNTFSACMIRAA
jgi:hypothetical protein